MAREHALSIRLQAEAVSLQRVMETFREHGAHTAQCLVNAALTRRSFCIAECADRWRKVLDGVELTPVPIRIILHCPSCDEGHVDEGEWETRPHKTHQCQLCGHEWRPSNHPTVGVATL